MTEPILERALKRDRWIVWGALVLIAALSWAYLIWLYATDPMLSMDMAGMPPMAAAAAPWDFARFAFLFAMWSVMMAGMMTPAAAPIILLYARVARSAAASVFAPTSWFALGYLAAWFAFALSAAVAQSALEHAALMTPMMALALPRAGAIVLIAGGLYQWSPWKDQCLAKCRAPLSFIQAHGGFKPQAFASVRLGLLHGLYCIGCCWALMALLFVAGVMNVFWIAALAFLVLAEKVFPGGRWIARIVGLALIGAGVWMFAQ